MNAVIEEAAPTEAHQKFTVVIIYNGIEKKIEIDPHQTVKALLERAIAAFGNLPSPHTLSLWTAAGVELTNEQQSISGAGIKSGDELLLRPGAVKGG